MPGKGQGVRVCEPCYRILTQPPVSPSPPIARGSTSTVQPTTTNNTISNMTPTPMHPDDLPKFLKQEWNAPPSQARKQPLPPSSLMQPAPGTPEFSPDLIPRFLKMDHVPARPNATPHITPPIAANRDVQAIVVPVTQDDMNLRMLQSLAAPAVKEVASKEEIEARLKALKSDKTHGDTISDDELALRFQKLAGRPLVTSLPDNHPGMAGEDSPALDMAAAAMINGVDASMNASHNPGVGDNTASSDMVEHNNDDLAAMAIQAANEAQALLQQRRAQQNPSADSYEELQDTREAAEIIERVRLEIEAEKFNDPGPSTQQNPDSDRGSPNSSVREDTDEICCICSKKASGLCLECDRDPFCQGCFTSFHQNIDDDDEEPHAFRNFRN